MISEKSPEPSNEPPTPPRKLTQTTTKSANPTNTAQPMPRPAPQNPSKKQLPASTNEVKILALIENLI